MQNIDVKPLVSIIVPVYNVEQYLPQCLDSIVNQTYKNIEVICVNDGSPDNSINILEDYAARDSRIKIVSQKNQGVSRARNLAHQYVNGDYIIYVDGDDWLDVNTCEIAVEKATESSADVVMWSYISESKNRSDKKIIFGDEFIFDETKVKQMLHRRFIGIAGSELAHPEQADSLCPVWGKMYKSNIILKSNVKFVDLDKIGTYEDGLFNLEVFKYVHKAVYLPVNLYHYRRTNSESQTAKYRPGLFEQWQKLFDEMQLYIGDNGLSEEYEDALSNRIALSILGLGLNILSSDFSAKKKKVMIKEIITSDRYKEAYKKLEFKYFPIHWKLFYSFAKAGNATGVYMLLKVIQRIIK